MPVYRSNTVFEVARGVKCFLALNLGVTRGQVPGVASPGEGQNAQELGKQLQSAKEELANKDQRISNLEKRLRDLKSVSHEGSLLPPAHMRPNSKQRKNDNEVYLNSARHEVKWMADNLGLNEKTSFLDLGCGPGRIAIGILDTVGEIEEYRGVDVNERYVRWAQHNITFHHPNFQFRHINLKNDHYNPKGEEMEGEVNFPFSDEEFDIVCLFSVFSHMLTEDVRKYLKELRRVIGPSGRILMTANLEDGVPDVTENPEGYRGTKKYIMRLQTVRYNREFFEGLLEENGLNLEGYEPSVKQGQRTLIVSKKGE